ncbi:MAG: chorismate mutase [Alphaproteobacteria bacterium]|nr:chorismate mutase [Alphaproteobacteria bacterium]MBU0859360.1 chorismate mutase [Alphaproteobacteria bacterium]
MEILKPYRQRIDDLDDRIIDLLVERTGVIREVGHLKFREGIPAVLQDRVDEVRERATARAAAKGLDADMIRRFWAELIDFSCNLEETIKDELAQKKSAGQ